MLSVEVLKTDLLTARNDRDKIAETAIKRAIGRIETAEAPVVTARYGEGPSEVERLVLSAADIRACLEAEIDESLSAVAMYEAGGRTAEATQLRSEAAVLARYLVD